MMEKHTLFYVESPFQLLQVYEALKVFNINKYKLIIRGNSNEINNNQILSTANELDLNVTRYIKVINKISLIKIFYFIFYNIFSSEKVFFGDENSIVSKLLVPFIGTNKIVFLDDGVASLNSKSKYYKFSIFDDKFDNSRGEIITPICVLIFSSRGTISRFL